MPGHDPEPPLPPPGRPKPSAALFNHAYSPYTDLESHCRCRRRRSSCRRSKDSSPTYHFASTPTENFQVLGHAFGF